MRNRFIGAMILGAALMSSAWGQQAQRPATVAGHPNLNGIWQAMNTANWDLQGHEARKGLVVALLGVRQQSNIKILNNKFVFISYIFYQFHL